MEILPPDQRQVKWDIYLGKKKIDTVYYTPECTEEYVRESLINHDGYPDNINIRRSK